MLAELLSRFGWLIPACDAEYKEPKSIRNANRALMRRRPVDCERVVDGLPRPWVLKDPRFCETLEIWLSAFAKVKPLLLWLERDEAAVTRSWTRRNEDTHLLISRLSAASKHFEYWPWAKMRIQFEK